MRDTTTGITFEEMVGVQHLDLIDVSQHSLYRYLSDFDIDWRKIISKKLLPDQAFIDRDNNMLYVYEVKYQQTEGSADEKPQTCAFKIQQFNRIAWALGLEGATYTYIFNEWFKDLKYRDMLDYIESVPGCGYVFAD